MATGILIGIVLGYILYLWREGHSGLTLPFNPTLEEVDQVDAWLQRHLGRVEA